MPVKKELVINTGHLIALVAATGGLEILPFVFARIIVPPEVKQEIHAGGTTGFAVKEFNHSTFLHVPDQPTRIPDYLRNSLDLGEASVIQLARENCVKTVCIDEAVGRRCARLNGLSVTGSIGIMLHAHRLGYPIDIPSALDHMQQHGIWLSRGLMETAINLSRGQLPDP